MTIYTAPEWATRALQRASITAEDDVPTAAQISWAQTVGSSLFDECVANGVPFINGSSDELPGEYYNQFTELVAVSLKAEVGLMSDADAVAAREAMKMNIRRINWRQPTGAVAAPEYF